jgi:hypothetical protein
MRTVAILVTVHTEPIHFITAQAWRDNRGGLWNPRKLESCLFKGQRMFIFASKEIVCGRVVEPGK